MLLFELCVKLDKSWTLFFFFPMKYHFLLTARETSGFRRHIFFCLLVFGSAGSLFLCMAFLKFWGAGATQVVVCRLLIRVAFLVEEQGL